MLVIRPRGAASIGPHAILEARKRFFLVKPPRAAAGGACGGLKGLLSYRSDLVEVGVNGAVILGLGTGIVAGLCTGLLALVPGQPAGKPSR